MEKIDNIQVFAVSVAQIMDQLYRSFPMPCRVSASTLEELYGPSAAETEPRVIQPNEADYSSLLPHGFRENTSLAHVAFEAYSESVQSSDGYVIWYWTRDQRISLRDLRQRVIEVTKVFDATLDFLLREQYICKTSENPTYMPFHRGFEYVLTSKGFSHLNKSFEGGTIRDEFQHRTSNRVFTAVKGTGDVAAAGKAIVDALSAFFM